jgi:hypothetical protein
MIGVIKAYDPETQTGTISTGKEDFQFDMSKWIANAPPEQGDHVKFDLAGVKPFNIDLYAASLKGVASNPNGLPLRWLSSSDLRECTGFIWVITESLSPKLSSTPYFLWLPVYRAMRSCGDLLMRS